MVGQHQRSTEPIARRAHHVGPVARTQRAAVLQLIALDLERGQGLSTAVPQLVEFGQLVQRGGRGEQWVRWTAGVDRPCRSFSPSTILSGRDYSLKIQGLLRRRSQRFSVR